MSIKKIEEKFQRLELKEKLIDYSFNPRVKSIPGLKRHRYLQDLSYNTIQSIEPDPQLKSTLTLTLVLNTTQPVRVRKRYLRETTRRQTRELPEMCKRRNTVRWQGEGSIEYIWLKYSRTCNVDSRYKDLVNKSMNDEKITIKSHRTATQYGLKARLKCGGKQRTERDKSNRSEQFVLSFKCIVFTKTFRSTIKFYF